MTLTRPTSAAQVETQIPSPDFPFAMRMGRGQAGVMSTPGQSMGGESFGGEGAVVANGRHVPLRTGRTLEQFLEEQGLRPRSVVVELNGEAVAPSEFAGRALRPGDRLEIVRIVAGG